MPRGLFGGPASTTGPPFALSDFPEPVDCPDKIKPGEMSIQLKQVIDSQGRVTPPQILKRAGGAPEDLRDCFHTVRLSECVQIWRPQLVL
jgi:hypothetical protein